MKNFTLHLIHIRLTVQQTSIPFSFLVSNTNLFFQQLHEENQHSILPIQYDVVSESNIDIHARKDKVFHTICSALLAGQNAVRFDGFLPFESHDINIHSVKNNILIDAKVYTPKSRLELFLHQHHILYAYYRGDVSFTLESVTTEYSKEHGHRDFKSTNAVQQLQEQWITGDTTYRTSSVHHAETHTHVITIHGYDDDHQPIHVSLT